MDTITAISTPCGTGGISVIRISGEKSFSIISDIFSKDKECKSKFNIDEIPSHTIHFGYIKNKNEIIDEVLISIFKNPNSYTGEDVIEISCHGGVLITNKIISLILSTGARHAEPGEFTKRAFLNGRIDLLQAEAVVELINAETDLAHSASIRQLEGSLSEYLNIIRQEILNVTALIELELDFAEENLEFVNKSDIELQIKKIISDLKQIIDTYISGKIIRDGVNLVISGKPNSGKSSLFNTLLKSERAIVSTIPGTTRDYLEESVIINGILFNLTDTAGLHDSKDEIEIEGISRSHTKIKDADLIIYLIDSSSGDIKEDIKYFTDYFDKEKSILVFSKSDLAKGKYFEEGINVSIYDEKSILELKENMSNKFSFSGNTLKSSSAILTNLRHKICLEKVNDSLKNAIKSINGNYSGEFISVDLRNALHYLGEITGEVTNDDILNLIFSKFCVGK